MYLLYSLLLVMLVLAMSLLALPFIINKTLLSRQYVLMSLFLLCFSLGVYQLSSDKTALGFWLTQGKERYRLLSQFDELGGIDGAIQRIQEKLTHNPNDAHGWLILAKLYEAKSNQTAAKEAITKAYRLDPKDKQIQTYYQKTIK